MKKNKTKNINIETKDPIFEIVWRSLRFSGVGAALMMLALLAGACGGGSSGGSAAVGGNATTDASRKQTEITTPTEDSRAKNTSTTSSPESQAVKSRTPEKTSAPERPELTDGLGKCTSGTRSDYCLPEEQYRVERARIASAIVGGTGGGQYQSSIVAQFGDSSHYRNQWGLDEIHANQAYADIMLRQGENAKPGAGVKVGVIDTGIRLQHPAFAGEKVQQELFAKAETGQHFSHGTAVSSVIVARPDAWDDHGESFYGVAWGADLKMFAVQFSGAEAKTLDHYQPLILDVLDGSEGESDSEGAHLYRHVLWEVDVVNLSFSVPGIIDNYEKADLWANYKERIKVWGQASRAEKTILVWAAGNANGKNCFVGNDNCNPLPNPVRISTSDSEESKELGAIDARSVEILSGMPLYFPELRNHTIAVVSVAEGGEISNFSNRCGSAAEWCIAAPGSKVRVAYFGPPRASAGPSRDKWLESADGTSFAAPMVTGALAVMKGFFGDQLSNTVLVERLFATADKTGRYASKKIYGQGLLDLGAATRPQGESMISVSGSTIGSGVPVRTSSLASGRAFGDSMRRSFAGERIVTFDALGAPFSYELESFVWYARSSSLQERLHVLMRSEDILEELEESGDALSSAAITTERRLVGGVRVSPRTEHPDISRGVLSPVVSFGRLADGGHLSVAKGAMTASWDGGREGLSATAFSTQTLGTGTGTGTTTTPTGYTTRNVEKPQTSGGLLVWQPSGFPVGLRAGWMAEQGSVLGASGTGAFGNLTGQTGFLGLHTGWKSDTWSLRARAEFGTMTSRPQGSLIRRISGVITSTFKLSATRRFGADRALRISLSQPLRVETGRAFLVVPIARTKEGAMVRRSFGSDLAPSGRQMDFALSWHHRLSEHSGLRLSGVWAHNAGHRMRSDAETTLLLGWKHSF